MEIEKVIGDCEFFLNNVFQNLEKAGFFLDEFEELDHIAYRTESIEKYEEVKNKLVHFSEAYNEKIFNDRLIFVCRLKMPIKYGKFSIKGIELLAPKENNKHKNGLEHAEFVIKTTLLEFQKKHSDIEFNLDAYDRKENPELEVEFKDHAVKFHEQSLLEVRNI
ncbi:MAG: VOC family protein [Candidatus Moranbacteria bacterium]|jgi:predicted metalloenzyme YecM|nr:VOC family protein [Candidatus Moranbacteria bacterium]